MSDLGSSFSTFVLMLDNKYAKFGSYSQVYLVENPLKASLYSLERLARVKTEKPWYVNEDLILTGGGEFSIIQLEVRVENVEDVS